MESKLSEPHQVETCEGNDLGSLTTIRVCVSISTSIFAKTINIVLFSTMGNMVPAVIQNVQNGSTEWN